jgi:phosphatidylinositol-4,5-bisphosphate 3-kinase
VSQNDFLEALQNFPSPLESSYLLGNLDIGHCRVMDSSKKPLWLVWSNPDPTADVVRRSKLALIFKNGDGVFSNLELSSDKTSHESE